MRSAPAAGRSIGLALALSLLGCGGEHVEAPLVIAAPPRRAVTSAGAPRSSADLKAPAPPPEAPEPEALRFFLDHLSAPAVPLASAAPPGVAAIALANSALGEAAGLAAQGPPVFARLAVGQRVTLPVSLPPGRCVTFLAQGGLGVIEIDLFLTTPATGAVPAFLASEVASGPVAVIGGRHGCLPTPEGAPPALELHVVLRRGEGAVLVQTFARDAPP
ncbi:MAG: hypothetical protein ABJE95_36230 [Byssovorax sp.]